MKDDNQILRTASQVHPESSMPSRAAGEVLATTACARPSATDPALYKGIEVAPTQSDGRFAAGVTTASASGEKCAEPVTSSDTKIDGKSAQTRMDTGVQRDVIIDATTPSLAAAPQAAADDDVLALHRQLAAETLRADQGWQRYESKNRECLNLRAAIAEHSRVGQAGKGAP